MSRKKVKKYKTKIDDKNIEKLPDKKREPADNVRYGILQNDPFETEDMIRISGKTIGG